MNAPGLVKSNSTMVELTMNSLQGNLAIQHLTLLHQIHHFFTHCIYKTLLWHQILHLFIVQYENLLLHQILHFFYPSYMRFYYCIKVSTFLPLVYEVLKVTRVEIAPE